MELSLSGLHWPAVVAAVVAGQILSTLWFTVVFGDPWAQEYGAADRKQHTAEIPGYTYGVQLLCTVVMVLSVGLLQQALGAEGVGGALTTACFVTVGFAVATALPGLAFLKRWRVAAITLGNQAVMILAASLILGLWR